MKQCFYFTAATCHDCSHQRPDSYRWPGQKPPLALAHWLLLTHVDSIFQVSYSCQNRTQGSSSRRPGLHVWVALDHVQSAWHTTPPVQSCMPAKGPHFHCHWGERLQGLQLARALSPGVKVLSREHRRGRKDGLVVGRWGLT